MHPQDDVPRCFSAPGDDCAPLWPHPPLDDFDPDDAAAEYDDPTFGEDFSGGLQQAAPEIEGSGNQKTRKTQTPWDDVFVATDTIQPEELELAALTEDALRKKLMFVRAGLECRRAQDAGETTDDAFSYIRHFQEDWGIRDRIIFGGLDDVRDQPYASYPLTDNEMHELMNAASEKTYRVVCREENVDQLVDALTAHLGAPGVRPPTVIVVQI